MGVLSLLYRHPDVFHRAVSADAPIWGGANEGRSCQERIFRELDVYVPERLGDGRDNTTRGETKE